LENPMSADFNNPTFQDPDKAREWLESELWPDGPVCPHCGTLNENTKVGGKTGRPGLYMCNACRSQFTVTVGTLMERSKIPLNKWLFATYLLMASKKGMSTHQLSRMLGVSLKSTWFLMHRIREALPEVKTAAPLGGEGKIVEADTTWIGGKEKNKHRNKRGPNVGGRGAKQPVHTLVERGGRARSEHVAHISGKTLRPIVMAQVSRKSALMTDEGGEYFHMGKEFASHGTTNHQAGEYVRGDVHSNTVESYFATLKRGITGVYHSVSEAHLKRYLGEFDFRYNERSALGVEDAERTAKAVRGMVGKRLTYRTPHNQAAQA
jgi:transposase-like protein